MAVGYVGTLHLAWSASLSAPRSVLANAYGWVASQCRSNYCAGAYPGARHWRREPPGPAPQGVSLSRDSLALPHFGSRTGWAT